MRAALCVFRLAPFGRFKRRLGLCLQKILPAGISWRKVKRGHLSDPGPRGDAAGLPGSEVVFGAGNLGLLIEKCGFDEQVIRCFSKVNRLVSIGFTVADIDNVADFLTRSDQGNFFRKRRKGKPFFF